MGKQPARGLGDEDGGELKDEHDPDGNQGGVVVLEAAGADVVVGRDVSGQTEQEGGEYPDGYEELVAVAEEASRFGRGNLSDVQLQ